MRTSYTRHTVGNVIKIGLMMTKTIKVQITDIDQFYSTKCPKNHSPEYDYCRQLLEEGHPEDTRLEIYRGEMLCLTIFSVGEGAKWAIIENNKEGPRKRKYESFISNRIGFKAVG